MTHRTVASATILVSCLIAVSACSEDPASSSAPIVIPSSGEQVIYSKHIAPIFKHSCDGDGCHYTGTLGGGLSLASWSDVMAGSDYGAMVVPYSPTWSHLMQHISTDTSVAEIAEPHMPIGRDPLPDAQIRAIQQWIAQGAKNDDGVVALSGDRPRAWVTNQASDRLTAIDIGTDLVARYQPVGVEPDSSTPPEAPHNVVLSPDGRDVYVNLIASGYVEKYDAVTFERLGRVAVGPAPAQIVVTADGSTLYVSNFNTGSSELEPVFQVDAATMTVTKVIEDVGYAPHGVQLSPDEKTLYTCNANSDDIGVVDLKTGELSERIPVAADVPPVPVGPSKYQPYQGLFGSDPDLFFFTCRGSGEVRVLNVKTKQIVDVIPVGQRPLVPGMTPDHSELWIPNQGSNSVSIIDMATRKVVATVEDLQTQPHAVGITADGTTAFVSCENQKDGANLHHPISGSKRPGIVYVIDVATRTVREQIETASFAAGVAVAR